MADVASEQQTAGDMILSYGAIDGVPVIHPKFIFGLIERAAETIRWLQQENERVTELEQACRLKLERDRARWWSDLKAARHAADAGLARATAAETEALDAKAHARLAIKICKETYARERAAIARAEAAEERARVAEEVRERLSKTPPAPPAPPTPPAPPASAPSATGPARPAAAEL